jgi:outer membrane immunogenic protein
MKQLRHYLLASASSAALIGNAVAADMPAKASAPVLAAPVLSWAGPYVGINLGAAWNHADFSDLGNAPAGGIRYIFPASAADPFWAPNEARFTIGGQAGYNFQTGNFVYGIEGDLNWVDGKVSGTFGPPLVFSTVNATSNLDWMATIRGRLGLTFSQVLVYGTGGVAFARFSDAWGLASLGAHEFSNAATRTAGTVGGGVEYMFARNWTAKIEALYANFGSTDVTVLNPGGQAGPYTSRFQHKVSTVRGGLNWKW